MRDRLQRLAALAGAIPFERLAGASTAAASMLAARTVALSRAVLTHRLLGPLAGLGALAAGLAVAVPLALATASDAFVMESADGRSFVAEVSGDGDRWVLLGHMFPTNRQTWDTLTERLLDEGYRVMRWDFRCHGASKCNMSDRKIDDVPDIFNEWEAAIDYAVEHGARELYGFGASFGGTSLMQVAAYRMEFDAVGAISSPNVFPNQPPEGYRAERLDGLREVAAISAPKLYIVGARNRCAYLYSDRFFQRSVAPSRLVVLETDLHGTDIIDHSQLGREAMTEIVAFFAAPQSIVGKQVRNDAPDADAEYECYDADDEDD